MSTSLKHAVTFLTAFAILGTFASSASAASHLWSGFGSNDLGQGTVVIKVTNGRATVKSLQAVMACEDLSDGRESDRAFSIGSGPSMNLNQNRFNFRFSKRSGGRLGDVHLRGRLRSNGVGHARLDLAAIGRDNSTNAIIEDCQASLEYRLRRGRAF